MSPSSKKKTYPSAHVIRLWKSPIGSRSSRAAAEDRFCVVSMFGLARFTPSGGRALQTLRGRAPVFQPVLHERRGAIQPVHELAVRKRHEQRQDETQMHDENRSHHQ